MDFGKEFKQYAVKHHGMNSMHVENYLESSLTPYIIEERQMNVAQMDVFSRLMMDRIIFLGTGINDQVANIVQAQLLFLESADSQKDIQIYLNSPGGSVYAGLGIYDTMQLVGPDVATICTGMAASMGAVLLCAGADGKRSALQHSRVMIHQPLIGGMVCQRSKKLKGKFRKEGHTINNGKFHDKQWVALDPRTNHIYMTWTQFDGYDSDNPEDYSHILFSKTEDALINIRVYESNKYINIEIYDNVIIRSSRY